MSLSAPKSLQSQIQAITGGLGEPGGLICQGARHPQPVSSKAASCCQRAKSLCITAEVSFEAVKAVTVWILPGSTKVLVEEEENQASGAGSACRAKAGLDLEILVTPANVKSSEISPCSKAVFRMRFPRALTISLTLLPLKSTGKFPLEQSWANAECF